MENLARFSERLEMIMRLENLSAQDLAFSLHLHLNSIYTYLRGSSEPKLSAFAKFCEKYPAYSLDWLVAGRGSMYYGDLDRLKSLDQRVEDLESQLFISERERLACVELADMQRDKIEGLKQKLTAG